MKNAIIVLGILILVVGCTPKPPPTTDNEMDSFKECAAKYPVMESYPRQCNTPDGKHFVEEIAPEENLHECSAQEKAAEICTKEYMPVCGDNRKTYGNKCEACASKEIDQYTKGACSEE